jgi:hypothetical protein
VLFGTAWAETLVDIPDIHLGDFWKYRTIDGYTNETTLEFSHQVIKLDEREIVIQLRNKNASGRKLHYFTREWNQIDSGDVRWEPFNPEFKFPMSVGLKWNQDFKFSNNHGTINSSFARAKIVAFEKVTVPAGVFDAYRIERDIETHSNNSDANTLKGRIITWYAPAVKKFVRRESITFANGRERNKEVNELVEYSLQKK